MIKSSAQSIATPATFTPVPSMRLQRACTCGQHSDGGECEACKKKRETGLQRAAVSAGPQVAPPIVHNVLHESGQPLDAGARAALEPRFGQDFSRVRVHTGAQAAASARAVGARAYTVGRHIAFGAGQYDPGSPAGQRLLAHELTHTVQQGDQPAMQTQLQVGATDDPAEREADQIAQRVTGGVAAGAINAAPGGALQRGPEPDNTKPGNLGPPVQELPKPPICSIIWKDGKWSWKCENVPKLGSTPEIPLNPLDIPDRIRDLLPKGPGGGSGSGSRTFPLPPAPGSDLPPNWLEDVCKRTPMSPLCIPIGGAKKPDTPKPGDTLSRPVGIFWTDDVLFEHDQPGTQGGGTNGGMTAAGTATLDNIIAMLKMDRTLQVRLIGQASSEGDAAHNLELSKRRALAVYQKLKAAGVDGQVFEPPKPDGRTAGCSRLDFGVWACGAQNATPGEARPEERKVAVTFLRNPPLLNGPFNLTLPSFGGTKQE